MPYRFDYYHEPFVGGGAVFFALANEKRFHRAYLSDSNEQLVNVYKVVRDEVQDLIEHLRFYASKFKESPQGFYDLMRSLDPLGEDPYVFQAARFIFLNKTCFNGLWRVNRKGKFNVPRDPSKKASNILDEHNLRACSAALREVTIRDRDFFDFFDLSSVSKAVWYLDPPYMPTSATSNFTSYTRKGFTMNDQCALAKTAEDLVRIGATVVASNSDTRWVREEWSGRGFQIYEVLARRNMNSVASKRGPVKELLMRGEKT